MAIATPVDIEERFEKIERSIQRHNARLRQKWGGWTQQFGYSAIPNLLFFINKYTAGGGNKLTPSEYIIFFMLISFWWREQDIPFPSTAELALRANISQRQVFRSLRALEKKGFIIRVQSELFPGRARRTKGYDLTRGIDKLDAIAGRLELFKEAKRRGRDDLIKSWMEKNRRRG